jgi:hypothetical protein
LILLKDNFIGKEFWWKTLAAPSVINEAESIQKNGINVATDVTARKMYKIIFFIYFSVMTSF